MEASIIYPGAHGLPSAATCHAPVLHVVGCVTDEVFGFLGPASRALAKAGHVQHIVVVDAPQHRHKVRQLDAHAAVVRVAPMANPFRQWLAVVRACRSRLVPCGPGAVHVHGLIPCLMVSVALRSSGDQMRVLYSPHGARSVGSLRLAARLAMLAARSAVRRARSRAIVTASSDADAFDEWDSTNLIEAPVADAYFLAVRHETMQPLIVSGGLTPGARGHEAFAQLAVLLSGEELDLQFHWIGSVPDPAQRRLAAAGVSVAPAAHDLDFAATLATGWMYVAPGPSRGFPLALVQAMAAGLPCIAIDCKQHRDVMVDGETGLLCVSRQEMVHRLAMLVDNVALRVRLGAAARAVAHSRFGESNFEEKLLTAYSTWM